MPYLLILMSLIFVSCGKKENALSQAVNSSALEYRAFVIVNHENKKSIIRRKILNLLVEEKIPSNNYKINIEKEDEILSNEMNMRELDKYTANEKNMAKIVITYTDREEIFFIPKNIPINSIASLLNLKPEASRIFKWIKTDMYSTYAGGTFYLASVNTNDIVENDQLFYHETTELKDLYMNSPLKLVSGKIIELTFNYNVYIQQEEPSIYKGRNSKCTRDMAEAGMCGICTYSMSAASGNYQKMSSIPLSNLDLILQIGSHDLRLNKLDVVEVSENKFSIKLNSKNFDMEDMIPIHINTLSIVAIDKKVTGYNYSETCQGRSESTMISLQRRVDANVSMKVSGRGFKVLKNIL